MRIRIASIIISLLALVPLFAFAYHTDDHTIAILREKIAELTAKINALKAKKAPPPAAVVPSPVIKEITGPRKIALGDIGTWFVNAYDASEGTLVYEVSWNDDSDTLKALESTFRSSNVKQVRPTFLHAFQKIGSFPVTFAVTNTSGFSASTTINIFAGNALPSSLELLYPNGGETWGAESRQTIRWASSAVPLGTLVDAIRIREIYTGWEATLAQNTANDGREEVIVPTPIKAALSGTFEIEISVRVDGAKIFDKNDTPFTVVASLSRSGGIAYAGVLESIRSQLDIISAKLGALKHSLGY